ncbi:MAG: nucleotidyltransferase domain-containing protein [Candidatus Aenigmarchaeota archaeon]|nr:nucleotidyltransferase domain-containing protein [Candidatus Aenigmarchaeota archaeon]
MQNFDSVVKLAKKYSEKLNKKKNIVSIIQIGSSLRKEDFRSNSDLDLLVIYENPVKKSMEFDYGDGVEITLMRYGKEQFLKSLEEGNPVDLIALLFGKVLHDNGFFAEMKKKSFEPTEKTIEKWIHTATFNLMDAATNYSLPTCICCYFKALHHTAREFCRVIILKEEGELLEGDKAILEKLKTSHSDLYQKFMLIIDGRKNYEKFEQKYIKYPKIKGSGLGKYLLAAEDIAIKALKISMELNVPKINELISHLQKKYKIDHYHSFYIIPERKEMTLHLVLRGNKSGFFRYNLKNGKLIEAYIPFSD